MKQMRAIKMLTLAVLAAAVAASFQPTNGPGTTIRIRDLVNAADVVAVAGSVQAQKVGSQATFVLVVERVLKGSVLPGTAVHVVFTIPGRRDSNSQIPPLRCLWFLQSIGGNDYLLMPTHFGSPSMDDVCMSVPPGDVRTRFTYPSSLPAADKLAFEMGASAEAIANGEIKSSLPIAIQPNISGASPRQLVAVHRLLTQSSTPRARGIGYRGLLLQNDRSALEEIETQAASLLAQENPAGLIADGIRNYYRNSDPVGVAVLGRIATASPGGPTFPLKSVAARALASIHTREALPFLVKMLSDPDPDILTFGVGGLAMFANNEPVMAIKAVSPISIASPPPVYEPWYSTPDTASHSTMAKEIVMQRKAELVGFWTAWWQDNQATIMAGLPPKPPPPSPPIPGGTTTKGSSDVHK